MSFVEPSELRSSSQLMGVVLVDSMVFLRSKYTYFNCLQRMVDNIYDVTGVAVSAVARGGASFCGQVTYEEMLVFIHYKYHMEWPYKFLLVISMGNDIYVKGPDDDGTKKIPYELADSAGIGIRDFMWSARNLFDCIGLVFGGSSDVWQYSGKKGYVYDRLVDEVLKSSIKYGFQYGLDYVSSGTSELDTLSKEDIVDSIGHIHVLAYPKLETAVVSWIRDLLKQAVLTSKL